MTKHTSKEAPVQTGGNTSPVGTLRACIITVRSRRRGCFLNLLRCLAVVGVAAGDVASIPRAGATSLEHGPSPEVEAENRPEFIEMYRLRIENWTGGSIAISRDEGTTWKQIGEVILPAERVAFEGFTASKWAMPGRVCATSVNAIHVKTDNDATTGRGIIFSIVPVEQGRAFKHGAAATNPSAVIYTDIPGGKGIFGRWTLFVNGRVLVERAGKLQPLSRGYVPAAGDILVFPAERVARLPRYIEFENRFGGLICLVYSDETRVIGEVLRPVVGVGRFEGGVFADVGRVRANHPGVIDISTSPIGEVGGFQIVPANHAMSPETYYVRHATQWMVVGPVKATDPSWEGTAPLFSYFLQPRYEPDDICADDWAQRLLDRFRVEVRLSHGEWQAMPCIALDANEKKPLPGWAYTALKEVTHLRIVFPDSIFYGRGGLDATVTSHQ